METHTEEYEEELKTALVCEDNAELRNTMISTLEGLKYSVEVASGAEDT
ncbi:MAG: hypothetical protein HY099_07475, partial [Nitrospirae bacterium]|nr:hypothetical protein [Nitrospirota bacterium]